MASVMPLNRSRRTSGGVGGPDGGRRTEEVEEVEESERPKHPKKGECFFSVSKVVKL